MPSLDTSLSVQTLLLQQGHSLVRYALYRHPFLVGCSSCRDTPLWLEMSSIDTTLWSDTLGRDVSLWSDTPSPETTHHCSDMPFLETPLSRDTPCVLTFLLLVRHHPSSYTLQVSVRILVRRGVAVTHLCQHRAMDWAGGKCISTKRKVILCHLQKKINHQP